MTDLVGWLKSFDLGRWWKAAIAVGLVILVAAIAGKNDPFAIVGLSIVAFGFGEWMNHRMETAFAHGGTITSYHRHNRPMGLVLDGLGFVLALWGLYLLAAH
jgi:hypothetical protein